MKATGVRQVLAFIYKSIRPYPWSMAIMLIAAVMWAVELSLGPYMLKILLNRITDASPEEIFSKVKYPAIFYITTSFAIITSYRFYNYFVDFKMFPQMRQSIIDFCFNTILLQSNSFFQNSLSASLATKIRNFTDRVPDLLRIIVDRFFSHILGLSIAIYTLWQININFALLMLSWVVVFTMIAAVISSKITINAYIWTESRVKFTAKIVDVIINILSVRLFARREYERSLLKEDLDQTTRLERRLQVSYFAMWFSYGYSFLLVQALNLYFLILGKQQGYITVGDFALVMGINISIGDFLWSLTREFSEFSNIMGEVSETLKSIVVEPEIADLPEAGYLEVTQGKIEFESIKFYYKGPTYLYDNLSVVIQPGQKVGLVGYSGSGKTTFVNLILRLFNIEEGKILIDGQDIKYILQDSLREKVTMIPQEPILFNRSLMENIRYAKLGATDEEVVEAAKKAYADEFITDLPLGYSSIIGQDTKPSGGQKQRIALARAFLKNSPILIFDEATSQLDSVTESQIQSALYTLMQDKTTLVVAHRLSTLLHMDRIIVFDKGKIVEDGSHRELILKNGLYTNLWHSQVRDYLADRKDFKDDIYFQKEEKSEDSKEKEKIVD